MSEQQPSKDFYKILGVPKNATLSEIRSAHRRLVLKCHPDKVQEQSLKAAKQLEFQNVQEAYETLSDPLQRSNYDSSILQNETARRNPFEFEVRTSHTETFYSKANVKVHTYKNGDFEGIRIVREFYSSNKPPKTEADNMKTSKGSQKRREEAKRSPKEKDSQQEKKNTKEKIEKEKEKSERERREKERREKEKEKMVKERKEREKEKMIKEKREKEKKEKERKEKDKERLEKEKKEKEKEKQRKEKERKRDADEKLLRKTQAYVDYNEDEFRYPKSSGRKSIKALAGGNQKMPKATSYENHTEANTKPSRQIISAFHIPDMPFPDIRKMKSHSGASNFDNVRRTKSTDPPSKAQKSNERNKANETHEKHTAHTATHSTRQKPSSKAHISTPLHVRQKSSHVRVEEPTLQRSQTYSESRSKQNKKPEDAVHPQRSSNTINYAAESNRLCTEFCTVNGYTSFSHSQFSQSFYQSPNQPFSMAYYAPESVLVSNSTPPTVSSSPGIQTFHVNQVSYTQNTQGVSLENISYCQNYGHESVIFSPYMTP